VSIGSLVTSDQCSGRACCLHLPDSPRSGSNACEKPRLIYGIKLLQIWPHAEYPLIPVGKLVLDRNPTNYFAEVEQIAFSPSHMVPGIEPSPDKMLQVLFFILCLSSN